MRKHQRAAVCLAALVLLSPLLVASSRNAAAATATFGNPSVGTSSDTPGSGYKFGSVYALPQDGTTMSISWYARGGRVAQRFTPVVYRTDSTGNPSTLVAKGAEVQIGANKPAGWVTSALPQVALTKGNYLLGLLSGPQGQQAGIYYSPATNSGIWNANAYPNPTTSWGQLNRDSATWSIYVAYVAANATPPPANSSLPAISGTAQVGRALSASTGDWTNNPTDYAYQWRRCNTSGGGCADIAGATSSTYTLVSGDRGSTMRVLVVATNDGGSASATSGPTATVTDPLAPPANSSPPTISGTPQVGRTLTATQGAWSGNPVPTLTQRWQSCASGTCSDIAGATGLQYVVAAGDEGKTLKVVVTASNSEGSGEAASQPTATVVPQPPANTSVPTVSGSPVVGEELTTTDGTWSNSPTSYAYQWQRCAGITCTDISSATSRSYTVTSTDEGFALAAIVLATNAGGTTSASSGRTAVVTRPPAPPSNGSPPTISGTAQAGQTLTSTDGTWTGSPPPTFTRQWQSCAGNACSDISGATGTTYVVRAADVGKRIQVAVSATNSSGTATATSAPTPTVEAAPTVSSFGSTTPGTQTDTAGAGYKFGSVYTLDAAATLKNFKWYVRGGPNASQAFTPVIYNTDGSGRPTTKVTEGTKVTIARNQPAGWVTSVLPVGITLQPGNYLLGLLAGSSSASAFNYYEPGGANSSYWNNNGSQSPSATWGALNASAERWSFYVEVQPSGVAAPLNTSPPSISGTAQVGQSLTTSDGSWSNSPTSYAYQWQRCDSNGASCNDIPGATDKTYGLVPADEGRTLRVTVTATNAGGSATSTSAVTAIVVYPPSAPANTAAPTISGGAQVGQTLVVDRGSWSGNPAPTLSQQWQSCDSGVCSDVAGQTGVSYMIAESDLGKTIRVVVTAANTEGSAQASSAETSVVTEAVPMSFTKLTVEPNFIGSIIEKALADIDGDGRLDAVIGTQPSGSQGGPGGIYWYQFPASGNPADLWIKRTILSSGVAYEDMTSDDVDHDGHVDIIASVIVNGSRNVYWFENPGTLNGAWQQHLIGGPGEGENTIVLGDFDGDGLTDVATNTTIYFKNTPTSWTARTYNSSYNSVALLDIGSGTGAVNLVSNRPNSQIAWFENPRETGGNARSDPWTVYILGTGYPCDGGVCDSDAPFATSWTGDFNGDGRMDVVIGQAEGDNAPPGGLWWFEAPGDRTTTWTKHAIDPTFQLAHNVRVADLDGNGAPDVIAGEQDQSAQKRLAVYYNDGTGSFTRQILSTGASHNVALGDADGDGDVDILAGPHGFFGDPHPLELYLNGRFSR